MIKLEFQPKDLWIGVYWEYQFNSDDPYDEDIKKNLHIWICLIPMFPLHITVCCGTANFVDEAQNV